MNKREPWTPREKREILASAMFPATLRVARTIGAELQQAELTSVMAHYEIGTMLCRMTPHEPVFGMCAIGEIADYLAVQGGLAFLHQLRHFADEFARPFVEEEASTPLDNGRPFSLGHFLALLEVRSKKGRQELIRRARAEGMTVRRLRRAIREQTA